MTPFVRSGIGRPRIHNDSTHNVRQTGYAERKLAGYFFQQLDRLMQSVGIEAVEMEGKFAQLCVRLSQLKEYRDRFTFLLSYNDMRILVHNVKTLLASFAKYAHFKLPIVALLVRNLGTDFCIGLGIKANYLKKAKLSNFSSHDLFNLRYPVASARETITNEEANGIVNWAKGVLTGKSGSVLDTYICPYTKQSFHEYYLEHLNDVYGFIWDEFPPERPADILTPPQNRFEENIQCYGKWRLEKGKPLHLIGRSYEKFHDILSSRLNINFHPRPKLCKKCNQHNEKEAAVLKATRALAASPQNQRLKQKKLLAEQELNRSNIHQHQVAAQRKYINDIRDNLGPTERLLILDFVTFYGLTSAKFNILVIMMYEKVDGRLSHSFIDFIAPLVLNMMRHISDGHWNIY